MQSPACGFFDVTGPSSQVDESKGESYWTANGHAYFAVKWFCVDMHV